MPHQISLNGNWLCKSFIGADWLLRESHLPNTRDTLHWLVGAVPGSVQNDLWQNGEITNPYFERNTLLAEWASQRTWVYKKTFPVGAEYRGCRAFLRFQGVDYEAQFFLNGERLGAHRGMFTPITFDVSAQLRYGQENMLAVVVEPAPMEEPQIGETRRVRTHKSRMTYWWDFCPRLIQLGIWDDVFLEICDAVRIQDVFVRPLLAADFLHADVRFELELDVTRDMRADIEITIQRANSQTPVARRRAARALDAGQNALDLGVPLAQPDLWYPNGSGEPALYTAHLSFSENGAPLEEHAVSFGIRRVELTSNENADPTARPYTFVVNGQRIYINGWNWVPLDVMYGVERPEKLAHLIELARRAHVNMLRVWGGGLIEKETFYDACDRAGIMVWQEFIQSSSGIDDTPPDDPAFIKWMEHEAEQIIPRKRNHPSLVAWCGGNELTSAPEQPADERAPVLNALHWMVKRLDPDRLWFPTSPTGRVFMNSLENLARDPTALHDVHGPWEFQGVTAQQTLFNATTSLFHSEFGAEGITNRKTLDRVMAREQQLPVSLENPLWFHLGAWWVKTDAWREAFCGGAQGAELQDVDAFVRATQFLQAESVGYAIEANRRRMYQNSGSLPWQFNEPYPMAACTSAVDYYGNPKPLYYAVARAYAPLSVTAKFETRAWAATRDHAQRISSKERGRVSDREKFAAEIWAANAHSQNMTAVCTMRVLGAGGQVFAEHRANVTLGANRAQGFAAVELPLSQITAEVFFLDLQLETDQQEIARNRYVFTRAENFAPLMHVAPTQVQIERGAHAETLEIKNVGETAALFVWLDAEKELAENERVYFDDNYFCLLPGECRRVGVKWENVPSQKRRLAVQGWNTE